MVAALVAARLVVKKTRRLVSVITMMMMQVQVDDDEYHKCQDYRSWVLAGDDRAAATRRVEARARDSSCCSDGSRVLAECRSDDHDDD